MRFYLKPRGKRRIYQIQWTDAAGTPRRASTGTADRGEAELALARHRIQHEEHRGQSLSGITLELALVRYYEHHGRGLFAPDMVRLVMGHVVEHAPQLSLSRFTIQRQEQFVRDMNVSPGSARRYMGVIRAACEWMAHRGEITAAPRIIRVHAEDGPGARPFEVAELGRLLEACETPHEQRLFLLAVSTGARPEAILQLTWDRVREGVADYHVPGRRKTKKRRARAPLSAAVAAYLESQRGLGPVVQWKGRAMVGHRMTFERVAARAKVAGTFYGLRKALATWLRVRDVPEWEVGALLGHRVSSATTERYAHYRPDYMVATKAAVEALLMEIRPSWLAKYLPSADDVGSAGALIPKVANGLGGSREWDRTTDHLHVKELGLPVFRRRKAANDD